METDANGDDVPVLKKQSQSRPSQLRLLIQHEQMTIPGRCVMSEYIPKVFNNEIKIIKEELVLAVQQAMVAAQAIELTVLVSSIPIFSVFADGTTRNAETYNVVLRFILNNQIQQRVVDIQLLKYALNGASLGAILIRVLTSFGIPIQMDALQLAAFIHDRSDVNNVVCVL